MWRRILGFFGQFGYGGGFLVFSLSLDMEEDSWFFPFGSNIENIRCS